MNTPDIEAFEAELRRLNPARPPEALQEKLLAFPAREIAPPSPTRSPPDCLVRWPRWVRLRLWAPAAAVSAVVLWWIARGPVPSLPPAPPVAFSPAPPALQADSVELGQRLVASYDAVAEMPGGQPIRFRCREWLDEVVLRDSARGLVLERQTPRLEVVPVRFETD